MTIFLNFRSVFSFIGDAISSLFGRRKKRSTGGGCGIKSMLPDFPAIPGINLEQLKRFARSKLFFFR